MAWVLSSAVGLELRPTEPASREVPARTTAPPGAARIVPPADVVAVTTLAATVAGLLLLVGRAIPDDAYIYLRYVDNLASGGGWAFNAGQPSDAATSPAYTVFLTLVHGLGVGGPPLLLVGFGLGMLGLGLGLYFGLRGVGRLSAWAMAMTAVCWPALLRVVGLETSFFAGVVVLCALAYEGRWLWTAGVLAGVAALGRPEGLVLALLLAGLEIARRDGRTAAIVVPSLALVVPWKLFEWLSFGSLVPHTLQVKAFQGSFNPQRWITAFFHQVPLPELVLPLAVLGSAVAAGRFRRGRPFALVVIAVGLAQVLAYTALNAPAWYQWYFEPGNLSLVVAAALGLDALVVRTGLWLRRHRGRLAPSAPWHRIAGVALVVLGALCVWQRLEVPGEPHSITSPFRLSASYTTIGRWLRTHAPAGAWVATGKIGYIGYYSGLNVLDTMGLTDDHSVPLLAKEPWYWWFASRPLPRYVVVHVPAWPSEPQPPNGTAGWPATQYERFLRDYAVVYSLTVPRTDPANDATGLLVFERRSASS